MCQVISVQDKGFLAGLGVGWELKIERKELKIEVAGVQSREESTGLA